MLDSTFNHSLHEFWIADWKISPTLNQIERGERIERLPLRCMEVLVRLAESQGKVISRDQLLEDVWNDVLVEGVAVSQAISHLRKALNDDPKQPTYIETIPKRGYRLLAEVRLSEEDIISSDSTESGTFGPLSNPGGLEKKSSIHWPYILVLGVLVVVFSTVFLWNSDVSEEADPPIINLRAITTNSGIHFYPAVNGTGELIVYSRLGPDNHFDLMLSHRSGSEPERLTDTDLDEVNAEWSPLRNEIAFAELGEDSCSIVLHNVESKVSRRSMDCGSSSWPTLSWNPNGNALAVSDRLSQLDSYSIRTINLSTWESNSITQPPPGSVGDLYPAFSRDGTNVAFVRRDSDGTNTIMTIDVTTGAETAWTSTSVSVSRLDWRSLSDGLTFSGTVDGENGLFLLVKPLQTPVRFVGGNGVFDVSTSFFDDVAVFSTIEAELEIQDSFLNPSNGVTQTWNTGPGENAFPKFSPDGKSIAWVSNRSGYREVWKSDVSGANAVQLTTMHARTISQLTWRHDSEEIAFAFASIGTRQIASVDVRGGSIRMWTNNSFENANPRFGPPNNGLLFSSNRTGNWELWEQAGPDQAPNALGIQSQIGQRTLDGKGLYYVPFHGQGLRFRSGSIGEKVVAPVAKEDQLAWEVREDVVFFVSRHPEPRLSSVSTQNGHIEFVFGLSHLFNPSAGFTLDPNLDRMMFSKFNILSSNIMMAEPHVEIEN